MRTLLISFALLVSLNANAQFPAPVNFEFSYDYIMIDNWGYCSGNPVNGPAYCSHFSWEAPTEETEAQFEHYNLYRDDMCDKEIYLLVSQTNTVYEELIGIIGTVWVTAVYSNPEGESEPSNIEENYELPIGVSTLLTNEKQINYNSNNQIIELVNFESFERINIIDMHGKVIKTEKEQFIIDVKNLPAGLYIIEVNVKDLNPIRQKILKN